MIGARLFFGGGDGFEALGDEALDFEELRFVVVGKFSGASEVGEVVKLLPRVDIAFKLEDKFLEIFGGHKGKNFFGKRFWRSGLEKNDESRARGDGGDGEPTEFQVEIGQGKACLICGKESGGDGLGEIGDEDGRYGGGESGGADRSFSVDGETAGGWGREWCGVWVGLKGF